MARNLLWTDRFYSKVDGFVTNPVGIEFQSRHIDETKPCETELGISCKTIAAKSFLYSTGIWVLGFLSKILCVKKCEFPFLLGLAALPLVVALLVDPLFVESKTKIGSAREREKERARVRVCEREMASESESKSEREKERDRQTDRWTHRQSGGERAIHRDRARERPAEFGRACSSSFLRKSYVRKLRSFVRCFVHGLCGNSTHVRGPASGVVGSALWGYNPM